jgi:hypothetical protein
MCYSFVVYKYIFLIYFMPMWNCNILHIIYDKIDKSITLELHSIIQKCIANNIDANTRIQKLSNVFSQCLTNGWSTCYLTSCCAFSISASFRHKARKQVNL